jgi:hypothetical protein
VAALHREQAAGRWGALSLAEQLGNVGSEVSRALRWRDKNPPLFEGAMRRALELLDLTLADPRWTGRRKELARAREFLCGAWLGEPQYGTDLADLDRYFFRFALLARRGR